MYGTTLPISETLLTYTLQVISITDGQIFLEAELFFHGVCPTIRLFPMSVQQPRCKCSFTVINLYNFYIGRISLLVPSSSTSPNTVKLPPLLSLACIESMCFSFLNPQHPEDDENTTIYSHAGPLPQPKHWQ